MKNHKNEKIHKAIHENDRKINLHEIKAQTGAGNGYKDRKNINESSLANEHFINTNKFHKIEQVVANIEGRVNLHKIKAKTGAGNGYTSHQNLEGDVNTSSNNAKYSDDAAHKSHRIHAIFHANDRKLNLHEIKKITGAGSGYKH